MRFFQDTLVLRKKMYIWAWSLVWASPPLSTRPQVLQIWSGSRLRYASPLGIIRRPVLSLIEKPNQRCVTILCNQKSDHVLGLKIKFVENHSTCISFKTNKYILKKKNSIIISPLLLKQLSIAFWIEWGVYCALRVNTPKSQQTAGAFSVMHCWLATSFQFHQLRTHGSLSTLPFISKLRCRGK